MVQPQHAPHIHQPSVFGNYLALKLCTFSDDVCTVCGAPLINVRQVCGSWRPGLGDHLAAGLELVGITKARVAAAMGVDDCGCQERQNALNAFGHKLGIGAPADVDR